MAKDDVKEKANLPAHVPEAKVPGAVIDYGEDAGAGAEEMSRDEFKIPLLRILQSNSPQVDGPSAIDGARPGMVFNTATGEFWDVVKNPLLFVPCYRDHNYVRYVPRDPWGGGFVGILQIDDPLVLKLRKEQGKFGKLVDQEGVEWNGQRVPTEIVETYYLFGDLYTPDGQAQKDVIPFVSTQIGKYQNFMTRYNSIRYPNAAGARILPPLWAHRYLLSTRPEQNKKGKFHGWVLKLEKEPPVESRLEIGSAPYEEAKAFYEMLKSGAATVDREADVKAGGNDEAGANDEENIPF